MGAYFKASSVQDYVELIDKEKNKAEKAGIKSDFLFRGQRRDLPLLPKLARPQLIPHGQIKKVEKLIIEEFRRTSLPLSEFQPEDEWDLLALAQHHGLPTRLLDWTYSALCALWFTVKDGPYVNKKTHHNGVVWLLKADVEDFRTDTEKNKPRSNRITKIFRPKFISRRITAQDSVFTVHKILDNGKVIAFEKHKRFKEKLLKIVIPTDNDNFQNIRNQLNILGVNNATLLPDLDGLCAHLKWRYFCDK